MTVPYDQTATIIDNSTLEVVQRVGFSQPPAGAFLIEPEKEGEPGTCFVISTNLPYE